MEKLLQNSEWADLFDHGAMAIARLAPQDYHRFHAPVNGSIVDIYNISVLNKDDNLFVYVFS
jgi:phosphatidylserine decarboxylase